MAHPRNGELKYETSLNMLRMVFDLLDASRGQIPISTISERLEVHDRTVSRWLKAIAERFVGPNGVPLIEKQRVGNRAYAVMNREIITQSTVYFYAAVHAALQNLVALKPEVFTDYGAAVKADIKKHALKTKPHLYGQIARAEEVFAYVPFGPKNYEGKGEVLEALLVASLRRRECRVEYRPVDGEIREMRVRPLCVVLYRDGLYMRLHALRDNEWKMRTLVIDRVQSVELLNDEFRRPRGFDPKAIAEGRLGIWSSNAEKPKRVTIDFSPDAYERAFERDWPGQIGDWEQTEAGCYRLELELPVTPEFETWLLTWGGKIEVVGPESLRDVMRQRYADALELYI